MTMMMMMLVVLLLFFSIVLSKEVLDSDAGLNMIEIVEKRGYDITSHYVNTKDGYILQLFHITNGNSNNKPPVLLQHGLFDSSYTWVNNFANESLAYILISSGFDVWCGNNRGNTYSRNHTTLDPNKDAEFWEFTFNEMAEYDDDSMINYILSYTKYEKLSYIGHRYHQQ